MNEPRIHVLRVACEFEFADVILVVQALEVEAEESEIKRAFHELPTGRGVQTRPEIPSKVAHLLRLIILNRHLVVEGQWLPREEKFVVRALSRLSGLDRERVRMNWRPWETAKQAIAEWSRCQ